ncbi:MAG TPA: DUF4476 domain-containing protein [Flavobacteriales bacterium]|nr:DUF4476 domain-containing protein [Flavobacteriales bacterium]
MNLHFTRISFLAALGLLANQAAHASEFFLKINRNGQHTALVGDQYQTNTSNVYKFFDLPAGTITVKISDGSTGNLVFDGTINLQQNERLVAEMNASGGMSTIASMTVTYTNWYTENRSSSSNNNTSFNNTPPAPATLGVSPEKFNEIVSAVKAQNVESYKIDKAKSIVKKNMLSSKQVAELCNLFKVESYKFEFAKFAYDYTVDKDSYYLVGKTFKVASYSKELDQYIDGKQ